MTVAKAAHVQARALALKHLDMHPGKTVANDLDPAEVGIVGDGDHKRNGSSYHLGKSDLRPDSYTIVESARDRRGLDEHASAMDFGRFKVTTRKGTFDLRHFSRWLVNLCAAGDPDTVDIREVIYTLDGKTVHRWDRLKKRSSGDLSHLLHTHVSEFRDASGARMLRLVTRYLIEIGLLAGGDNNEMAFLDDKDVQTGRTGAQMIVDLWWANFKGNAVDVEQAALKRVEATLAVIAAGDQVDEAKVAALMLAALTPEAIARAIPAGIVQEVLDGLAARLAQ